MTLPLLAHRRKPERAAPAPARPALRGDDSPGHDLCYGAIPGLDRHISRRARLALLQSNIEQRHKQKGRPRSDQARFAGLVEQRALARRDGPDLIVWPETSYPYGFIAIDPAVDPATLKTRFASISTKITAEPTG